MHRYFGHCLKISDSDLSVLKWSEVVSQILRSEPDEHKSALVIAQEILKYDNYISALVSDPSILTWRSYPIPMTRFFFYWFKLSLTGLVLDATGGSLVNGASAVRATPVSRQLRLRFLFYGVLLLIATPFLFCFELLYLIFHYSQAIRTAPGSLSLHRWTPQAKWLIREYNELPHLLAERIAKSYEFANYYMDLFPSPLMQPILKIVAFFSGMFITILFVAGLLTDSVALLTLEAFHGKSFAWLLSVLASIYGICRVSIAPEIHPYTAEECMEVIEKHVHYDFRDKQNSAQSLVAFAKFSSMFRPIIFHFGMELLSVILNPILFLFALPSKAEEIVNFIAKNSVKHSQLGWICKSSVFESDPENPIPFDDRSRKLERSMRYFGECHGVGRVRSEPLIDLAEEKPRESWTAVLEGADAFGDDEMAEIIGEDGESFIL
jgi:autophagy-related protein 9